VRRPVTGYGLKFLVGHPHNSLLFLMNDVIDFKTSVIGENANAFFPSLASIAVGDY
jgi:hypothetical protein